MPAGIPVATVALDGGKNAGILAAEIIGTSDVRVADALATFKGKLKDKVMNSIDKVEKHWKLD
jgi:5-(carboxyamino)imidazole ribonucleotide mutase